MSLLKEILKEQEVSGSVIVKVRASKTFFRLNRDNITNIEELTDATNVKVYIKQNTYKGKHLVQILFDELPEIVPNLEQLYISGSIESKVAITTDSLPRNINVFKNLNCFNLNKIKVKDGILPKEYLEFPNYISFVFSNNSIKKVELPSKLNENISSVSIHNNELEDLEFINYLKTNTIEVDNFMSFWLKDNKINLDNLIRLDKIFRETEEYCTNSIEELPNHIKGLENNIALGINLAKTKKALKAIRSILYWQKKLEDSMLESFH